MAPKIDPQLSQSGPGRRQGVPENQQKYEQIEKRKRKHKNENKTYLFYVRRFPQKTEGSTAGRLPMFYFKNNNTNFV
jgi:hypothetical protein